MKDVLRDEREREREREIIQKRAGGYTGRVGLQEKKEGETVCLPFSLCQWGYVYAV